MSSYKELLAQREQLDKQIKEAIAREKADGIAKAKLIIEQYGLSASDLFSRKSGGKSAGGKVADRKSTRLNSVTLESRMPSSA